MDILVITWNYPPRRGGMEQLLARLCQGLGRDHRVSVITAHADAVDAVEAGLVFRAPRRGLVNFFLYALWQGAALLRANRAISIVLGGSVLVAPLVVCLGWLFRRPASVLAHGLDVIYPRALYQTLIVRWLRLLDRVIANSQHTILRPQRQRRRTAWQCSRGESDRQRYCHLRGRLQCSHRPAHGRRQGTSSVVGR